MPTLRRLIGREGYRLHDVYSGLPSTTPAAQAELFYGVRTAVPAFVFVDRATRQSVKMISSDVAAQVEQRVSSQNPGLLAEGSAYSNIYTGGAAEPHFCAAALGWNGMFRSSNPISLILAVGWNAAGIVRLIGLLLWEIGAIVIDLTRGLFGNLDLKREWEFVPSRLGVGIVLQELMTMAACVDVARGLPVVQLNFLSYDERAHLRGPDSRFARQALRRIDAAIHRIWKAAHRSANRNYAVWVHSDHGQEATTPYDDVAGQMLPAAVQQVFQLPTLPVGLDPDQAMLKRSSYLRRRQRAKSSKEVQAIEREARVKVAAVGPVGHIYLTPELAAGDLTSACRQLATVHRVPMVVLGTNSSRLRVFTADGDFEWPHDGKQLVGDDHPFRDEIIKDLTALCRHPNAGEIVILGSRAGRQPISFVKELGGHAGMGPNESGAFALVPRDAPRPFGNAKLLRLDELRQAVRSYLSRERCESFVCVPKGTLRVVSYNVHSCVGLDGKLSPSRIARVLTQCDADVIALQELDMNRRRTGNRDQATEIAQSLGFDHVLFHPAMSIAEEQYGDAILSRLPMRVVQQGALPGSHLRPYLEPRGAIWAEIDFGGQSVQFINTHLGLLASERMLQVAALMGPEWAGHPDCRDPVVLLGDFNSRPNSTAYRRIAADFRDCQTVLARHRPLRTWFSPMPLARIDHVFIRGQWEVEKIEVPRTDLASVASDHLPLVVELRLCTTVPDSPDVTCRTLGVVH